MRLGIVRGHVVLSRGRCPALAGTLAAARRAGHRGQPRRAQRPGRRQGRSWWPTTCRPAAGQMIGVVEGREAAQPLLPGADPGRRLLRADRRTTTTFRATGAATEPRPADGRTRMKFPGSDGTAGRSPRRTSRPRSRRGATEIVARQRRGHHAAGRRRDPAARDHALRRRTAARQRAAAARAPAAPHAAPRRRAGARALFNSPEARGDQGRDRRDRQEALAAPVRGRQRRQHLLPHRAERGALHADARAASSTSRPRTSAWSISRATSSAGRAPRTSEIFLHLEIYKAVPEAKGVVHCHPPHATAYAITGRVPPVGHRPRVRRVRRGRGARAVRDAGHAGVRRDGAAVRAELQHGAAREPRDRLLGRHGDPRRVVRRGARDVLLDADDRRTQLGAPISRIPPEKAADLLSIKKRLGLPDPRLDGGSSRSASSATCPRCRGRSRWRRRRPAAAARAAATGRARPAGRRGRRTLVAAVTDAVMAALQK